MSDVFDPFAPKPTDVFDPFAQKPASDVFDPFAQKPEPLAEPGFFSTMARTGGQMVSGLGTVVEDVAGPGPVGGWLSEKGKAIEEKYPAGITSLADVAESPWLTAKESVGQMVPQIAASLPTRIAGGALGAYAGGALGSLVAPGPGTAAGAAIGGYLGQKIGGALPIGIQEYGGIREAQKREGTEDKAKALAAATAATAIEFMGGPETRIINKGLGLAGGVAKDLIKSAAKRGLKDVGIEGTQEAVQNVIEQLGASQDPTTGKSLEETAIAAIMGGVGGGVVGGAHEAVRQALGTPEAAPAATPSQKMGLDPAIGPLTAAAATAVDTGVAETVQGNKEVEARAAIKLFPFMTAESANAHAQRASELTKEELVVIPHPTVENAFATVPRTSEQAVAEFGPPPTTPKERALEDWSRFSIGLSKDGTKTATQIKAQAEILDRARSLGATNDELAQAYVRRQQTMETTYERGRQAAIQPETGESYAQAVRSDAGQVRQGSAEGQPGLQRGAVEGGGNLQQQAPQGAGNRVFRTPEAATALAAGKGITGDQENAARASQGAEQVATGRYATNADGGQTRISQHFSGSNVLDPTADVGAFVVEVRTSPTVTPLTLVLNKAGELVTKDKVLDGNDSNGTAWVPANKSQAAKVRELLARRANTKLGSPERKAIAVEIKTTVSGFQEPSAESQGIPRVQVGSDPNGYLNINAQRARDLSDKLGLTPEIERQFASGANALQVVNAMRDTIKEVSPEIAKDPREFIVQVRATLGVPALATGEGKADFTQWKQGFEQRQAAVEEQKPVYGARARLVKGEKQIVGAYGKNEKELRSAVENMGRLIRNGLPAKDWYKESAAAILDVAGHDMVAAERLTQLFAITSSGTSVKSNYTIALKAIDQFLAGKPIRVGKPEVNNKIRDLLYFGRDWEGKKTNDYYLNLTDRMRGLIPDRPVIDRHQFELSFGKGIKSGKSQSYELAQNMVRAVAKKFGLASDEAQAAMWVAKKAEEIFLKNRFKARKGIGMYAGKSDVEIYRPAFEQAKTSYADELKRTGYKLPSGIFRDLDELAAEIEPQLKNLTVEAVPSESTKLGKEVLAMPKWADRQRFTKEALTAVFGKKAGEIDFGSFFSAFGLNPTQWRSDFGAGSYMGRINPNVVFQLKVDRATVARISKAWQAIFRQEATPFFRADPALLEDAGSPAGVWLKLDRVLTEAQQKKFYNALQTKVGKGADFTRLGDNEYVIVNFRGKDGQPFTGLQDQQFIEAIYHDVVPGIPAVVKIHDFGAEGYYERHQATDRQEQDALIDAAASGSPALRRRLDRWSTNFEAFAGTGLEPATEATGEAPGQVAEQGPKYRSAAAKGGVSAFRGPPPPEVEVANFEKWSGGIENVIEDASPSAQTNGNLKTGVPFVARVYLAEEQPKYETVQAEPQHDMSRIGKLVGRALYGDLSGMQNVSVKELLQNSFDAVRKLLRNGTIEHGNIDIKVDETDRTVAMTDNGTGMSPDFVRTKFLGIAAQGGKEQGDSGGFAVAKLQFLYGNEVLTIKTLKDGVLSTMETTGAQLEEMLADKTKAPVIKVQREVEKTQEFPDGHGTQVIIKVPKTWLDPTTEEEKPVEFSAYASSFDALTTSPLFADVTVRFNDVPLSIGTFFPKDDYAPVANVDFGWGTARLLAAKVEQRLWGNNFHVLSNGLYQFSLTLKKNPLDPYSDPLPRVFYLDIDSKAKPTDPGYPFALNRQGFSPITKKGFDQLIQYVGAMYQSIDMANEADNFGSVQYLDKGKGSVQVVVSAPVSLKPEKGFSGNALTAISVNDEVRIENGHLVINGREIPTLSPEMLKSKDIQLNEFQMDQSQIPADKVLLHDNLTVLTDSGEAPITKAARDKFGSRFDRLAYKIGDIFQRLRDAFADTMGYDDLKKEPVGISFSGPPTDNNPDDAYRGVSIRIPFRASFLNIATPESLNPRETALGFFYTMTHEVAHHKVRNHYTGFSAELQRLLFKFEANNPALFAQLKKELISVVGLNADIIKFLYDYTYDPNSKPSGRRLVDANREQVGIRGGTENGRELGGVGREQGVSQVAAEGARPAAEGAGREASSGTAKGAGGVAEPGPDYGDPYAKIETRPGTTEQQKDVGRAALADIEKRILAGLPPSVRAQSTVLGSRIAKDFRADGGTSFIGQTVTRARDLATIAQVVRDPRFETFRVLYTDNAGKVVGERVYSSRLPGASFVPKDLHERVKIDRFALQASLGLGRGTIKYWMMHNHPSGHATPSDSDKSLTKWMAREAYGFAGHVIIDHNQFYQFNPTGVGGKLVQAPEFKAKVLGGKSVAEVPHPLLGTIVLNPQHLRDLAAQLQIKDDYFVLISVTGGNGGIGLVTEIPMSVISGVRTTGQALRAAAAFRHAVRETGTGSRTFAILPSLTRGPTNINNPESIVRDSVPGVGLLARSRIFADIIGMDSGVSLGELGMLDKDRTIVSNRDVEATKSPYARVMEEVQDYRAPKWYSALERQLAQTKQESAPAGQWKMLINNLTSKGVKADEIYWSGINDWLDMQTGKIQKQAVLDYVKKNGVQVTETMLGETLPPRGWMIIEPNGLRPNWTIYNNNLTGQGITGRGDDLNAAITDAIEQVEREANRWSDNGDAERASRLFSQAEDLGAYQEMADGAVPGKSVEFSDWQLKPEGKNYRELLLAIPAKQMSRWIDDVPGPRGRKTVHVIEYNGERHKFATKREADEFVSTLDVAPTFTQGHYKVPNVLAHVRFNERADAEGRRTLFIEEFQSDWAQKGRKEGFGSTEVRKNDDGSWSTVQAGRVTGTFDTERMARGAALNFSGIPSAPFVGKTEAWVALALKRMIRYAAENGFERVAWTTGEQQNARYSLSTAVDSIDWTTRANGDKFVAVATKLAGAATLVVASDGKISSATGTLRYERIVGKSLDEAVGKENAKKILEEDKGGLSGAGLDIGGQGMRAFYDRIVPNIANDLLKRLGGGRVEPVDIVLPGKREELPEFEVVHVERALRGRAGWQVREVGSGFVHGPMWSSHGQAQSYLDMIMQKVEKAAAASNISQQSGFTMTPAMRAKVLGEGFALFEEKPSYTVQVNGEPKPAGKLTAPLTDWPEETRFDEDGRVASPTPPYGMPDWVKSLPEDYHETLRRAGGWAQAKTWRERVAEFRHNLGERVLQGAVDQFRPIMQNLGRYPYMLVRMAGSSEGALESLIKYGQVYLNKAGTLDVKKGTQPFLEVVRPLGTEVERWMSWMAGNRAERLSAEGRERNFSDDDIARLKTLNQHLTPADTWTGPGTRAMTYAKAARDFAQLNASVLDVAEAAGNIEPTHYAVVDDKGQLLADFPTIAEAKRTANATPGSSVETRGRAAWEDQWYINFTRLIEEGSSIAGNVSGMVNQQGIKRLKGGPQVLHDLTANTVGNWAHLLSSALRNNSARVALEMAEAQGIAHKLTTLRADLREAGYVPEELLPDNAVYVLDRGKKVYYVIDDPMVFDALTSMGGPDFKGPLMQVMRKVKRTLTFGVTISPVFRFTNLFRDTLMSIATNQVSYQVWKNLYLGFKYSAKDNPVYHSALAGGGVIRMGVDLGDDRAEYIKRQISESIPSGHILDSPGKIKLAMKAAWDWWKDTGDRAENMTRMNLYQQNFERLVAGGMDRDMAHLEAVFIARDSMDFGLHGTNHAIYALVQTVPFMNARMQGTYKIGRGAYADPVRFASVLATLSAATLFLAIKYRDDRDWQEREDWDKNNFWAFKIGDVMYRVPKPFEIGALATVVERGYEALANGLQKTDRDNFIANLGNLVGDQLSMNPVPQLVAPVIQVWGNKSWFTGRQIESDRQANLSTPNRFGPRTTMAARMASLGMSKVLPDAGTLSPEQIDFLIGAYTGWMGSHIAMTADFALRPLTGQPSQPSRRLEDYFIVGSFARQLPANQSKYVNQFYDHLIEVQQAMGDLRELQQQPGREQAVREFVAGHRADLALSTPYLQAQRAIGMINQQIRFVTTSGMEPDLKRVRLDMLTQRKIDIARKMESSYERIVNQ